MSDDTAALRSLLQAGLGLARRARTGTVALARVTGVIADDQLPAPVRAQARKALDDAHAQAAVALDVATVHRALKTAWGRGPSKVLDEFESEPLSVSGLAQVHAAELDGAPVVVKVARPGLAQTARSELVLLDLLTGPLRMVVPATDIPALLREARSAAMDELDLEHEADQQARVRRALRDVDGVVVPKPMDELAATGVLVTERLNGTTLAAGGRFADPEQAAQRLVTAVLTAWQSAGLALTDVRPSHVVVLDDDRLGLLGTGVARPADRDRLTDGLTAWAALSDPDPDAFVAAVIRMELLDADGAARAHRLLRDVLGPFAQPGPVRLDGPAIAAVMERASRRVGAGLRLAAKVTPRPSDLAILRMLGQLAATLARLEATLDWQAVANAAAAEADA